MSKPMRYVGDGAFLPNHPARDLDGDEVRELGGVVALRKTGLYETFPDEVPASQDNVEAKEGDDNART